MIVFKNKGNYEGNVLISETRGGALTHQEVRDSQARADGRDPAWLGLRFMRGIRFNTRNINFLEISLTFRD